MWRRASATVLAVALLAGCGGEGGAASAKPTVAPLAHRPFRVGHRTVTFTDTARGRTLVTRIRWPRNAPGRRPVVLFAHGHDGLPENYDEVLDAVAAAGYVVVAPTFPLSRKGAPGGASLVDAANQPADESFLLDRVLPHPWLRADATRIAAGGHSLGAITTYGLVYNRCCHDDRVDAAFGYAPAQFGFGGQPNDAGRGVPFLGVQGEGDLRIPIATGRDAVAKLAPPTFFVTLLRADHSSAFQSDKPPPSADIGEQRLIVARVTIDFLDAELLHTAGAVARLRRDAVVPSLATLDERAA
jgi:dienelactone hydrolase